MGPLLWKTELTVGGIPYMPVGSPKDKTPCLGRVGPTVLIPCPKGPAGNYIHIEIVIRYIFSKDK